LARKILLADDSVTAQNMGRKILADAGYEVIAVNNGSAALKKIAEIKPDLVILDVYMPGYSGLEVCQRLKESPDTARIPVLLTVGKLEPFKPEEAKRVRAEGYIVKPFEASELLSTLSKLEDKVVPRSEPSKPGRFARAIALAEEASQGRRSEATGAGDGWQSRLSVPHAKPEPEEKVEDESTIYNAVNRDLRTVMEKPAGPSEVAKPVEVDSREAAETNLDVGALAPAGLPKDVTAEELAAIAAAAAQIQMAAAVASEAENPANGFAQPEAVAAVAQRADGSNAEDSLSATAKIEASGADSTSDAFVGGSEGAEKRRNGDSHAAEPEDVPVTMAAASQSQVSTSAGDSGAAGAARWTAVSVALEAEEASMSLDQEMQKAHAAFSAGVNVSASQAENSVPAPAETAPAVEIARAEAPAETPAEETVISSSEGVSQAESAPEQDAALGARTAEIETRAAEVSQPAVESASSVVAEPNAYQIISSKEPEPAVDAAIAQAEPTEQPLENFVSTGTVTENPEPISSTARADAPVSDAASNSETQPVPGAAITDTAAGGFAPIASAPETSLDHETVKTTAAAWASWRQVRDTGKSGEASVDSEPLPASDSLPEETNAKAVAAGAEQIDQPEAAAQNPSDVASIVDSVLADLRPKLMAEISRKMSEKK
jgi:CheY-like chemotaxis protein